MPLPRQPQDSRLPLWAGLCLLLLIVIGCARVVTTSKYFSQTSDEPAHLAAGMDWLNLGRYDYEKLHPPIARAWIALPPYLAGVRSTGRIWMWGEGNDELWHDGQYQRNLALARLGVLPFFVLAMLVAFEWSRRLNGNLAAVLTVLLLSTLPPLLAHAGLATTDVPFAAMGMVALYAFSRWLERRTLLGAVAVGLASGLAIMTKFSGLVFLPLAFVVMVLVERVARRDVSPQQRHISRRQFAIAIAALCLVIWTTYRFHYRSLNGKPVPVAGRFESIIGWNTVGEALFEEATQHLPFPDNFNRGLRELWLKSQGVEPGYVLGKVTRGTWYFFPVAIALKTPLPFLILAITGIVLLIRRREWRGLLPIGALAVILAAAMFARLNIGLRHVLILYPLLGICAGAVASHRWAKPRIVTAAVAALVACQVISSAAAHPRYLSYFNLLAGSHPEHVLVDSDLDWGQDAIALRDLLRRRGITDGWISYFGTTDLKRLGMPPLRYLPAGKRVDGWIAISQQNLQTQPGFAWLKQYQPVDHAGASIVLFDIPHATQ